MILWPWQKNQFRQLMVLSKKYPSCLVGRYLFFFFFKSNCYILPLWWKGRGVSGSTVRMLAAWSLESHPKRLKDKPWTHHLTSLHFGFPIICKMRITLANNPTKGLKGTMRKSAESTLNSQKYSCTEVQSLISKETLIPFWDINEWFRDRIICRSDTECSFPLK